MRAGHAVHAIIQDTRSLSTPHHTEPPSKTATPPNPSVLHPMQAIILSQYVLLGSGGSGAEHAVVLDQRAVVGIYIGVEILIGLLNTFSVRLLDAVAEVSGAGRGGMGRGSGAEVSGPGRGVGVWG